MNQPEKKPDQVDRQYQDAVESIQSTLARLRGCSDQERAELKSDLTQLNEMYEKIRNGRVEIVIFGEISTGKSALINALIGKQVVDVDVQGGWTQQVWGTHWEGAGHRIPGFENSELVLVDTPGINEVGGSDRAELAEKTARQADLILFVTDSDLNETEFSALVELAAIQKPIILVFNKQDLYPEQDLQTLLRALRQRLVDVISPDLIVTTAADPRPVEYVIEQARGSSRTEWRKPAPEVESLKSLILQTLDREGLGLIALNAAMFAADKSDRMAALRVEMRNRKANQVIWTMAGTKSLVVAFSPGIVDIVSGVAIDAVMILSLSKVYGLNFSMAQARNLSRAIGKAAGIFALGELTSWGASALKVATVQLGVILTAIPQGAAAGFSSYIIGQAAKHYFEHGGSWGTGSAKSVVSDILKNTDKDSVLNHLKDEIRLKLKRNRHAQDVSP
ncbi:MAG: GTP-binding protein [Mariniblastus sp.]|nr:GTP-binding protein [Mariniblastus sp.]